MRAHTLFTPSRPLDPFVFSLLWLAVSSAPCTHRDMRFFSSSRKSLVPCQSNWYHRSRGYKPTLIRLMTGADKMPDGLSGLKHRSLPVHLLSPPLFIRYGVSVHVSSFFQLDKIHFFCVCCLLPHRRVLSYPYELQFHDVGIWKRSLSHIPTSSATRLRSYLLSFPTEFSCQP